MSNYTGVWQRVHGEIEHVLMEWDSRPTAAIARELGQQDFLIWLLWDRAPYFEVWLTVPLEPLEAKHLADEPRGLLSESVAKFAGRPARLEIFIPDSGNSAKSISRHEWSVPTAAEGDIAVLAARALAQGLGATALTDEPPPVREALPDVARAMALYAATAT